MRRSGKVLTAAATLALLAACGQGGSEAVGEQVAQWSEAGSDWVAEVRPVSSVVIGSSEELQEWVGGYGSVAEEGAFDALDAVNLQESFLVIAGYPRCQETSRVVVAGDGQVRFEVVEDEPTVECAWSPYTIDAWEVPLSATGGHVPVLVD